MNQLGMFQEDAVVARRSDGADLGLSAEFPTKVLRFVLNHLRVAGPTSGEDLTDGMQIAGIVPPSGDGRSYGPATQSLVQRGLIEPYGVGHRRKGHGTLGANIWKLSEKGRAG